jgi:hypothetical protein
MDSEIRPDIRMDARAWLLAPFHACQRYGPRVPAPPAYVIIAKLSAQQPSMERPARADVIDQRGDQGIPRQTYLDDS